LQASRGVAVGSNFGHIIWRGDFNRHHPLWNRDEDERLFTAQAMRDANILIGMVANEEMALPKGEVTLRHMVTNLYSRLDNVWCSAEIIPLVIRCEVDAFLQPPCVDHFLIVTILDLPQERTVPIPTRNFRMVDWESFNIRL
jgi:Endonuclease-reverse transcriptase